MILVIWVTFQMFENSSQVLMKILLEHLKRPLEIYMEKLKKVKIVRADKREGLIKARLRGAEAAHGPVLTFLDSHVECTQGWLEPLLDRIEKDKKNVVVPIIEVNFELLIDKHASLLTKPFKQEVDFQE